MAFTLPNPPIWQQNRKYSARHDRTFADVLFTEGVLDPGSGALLVTQNSLGLDNSVDVAAGLGIIQGDDELNQGKYQRNALTPFVGQTIFNTDTDEIQVWTGSVWDVVGVVPPAVDPIPLILALS
jgi:hypothetical protein